MTEQKCPHCLGDGRLWSYSKRAQVPCDACEQQTADEIVEVVARAMYEAEHKGLSNCYEWDDHWEDYQEAYRPLHYKRARAAIAAVRPMIEAEEREKCARVAIDAATCGGVGERQIERIIGEDIAAAIRAMGGER